MDERILIKKCISGNQKAQKKFFDLHASSLMGVALRYMKDKDEAEDVLQMGFIKIFKNLNRFENKGSLEGWMKRIVVNTALDQLRKDKKRLLDVSIDDSYFEPSLDAMAESNLQAESLLKIIHSLPTGYQTVFNLFAIEGYSHKEIGEMLNISENTSKSQYSRARTILRGLLEKYDIER